MGVRGFELLVPDGIGERMAVVLQGPAGDEMDLFSYQFLAEGLREKEGVLVVLSRISPEEFREQMKVNGIDCSTHEKDGSLVIVDWYSYKMGRIDGVELEGSVLRSSKSLLNLEIALTDGMKKLSGYKTKRAVLDTLSPALKMFGSDEVYSFAQKIRTKLRDAKIASVFILEKGVHPDDIVQSIHQTFDGVIDITRETKEGVVERQAGLLFIRGVSYEPNYVDLELEKGEIVLREPASAEKKRVLKMLKKQEELLEKDPENERIWFSRANLFTEIDEFEKALESFDKVIELSPNHVGAWSGKADALLQLERRDEATEAYQKSLMLSAEKVDEEYFERLKPEEKPEVETRICPLCGSQALVTDVVCPECGTDFKKLEEVPREEGVLGYLEEMKEDMGVTEDELEDILEKKEDRERAARPRVERTGLTNGLARKAAKGLVNGLGRVNGLVNGLASARSGLTNGLTTEAASRTVSHRAVSSENQGKAGGRSASFPSLPSSC